MPLLGNIGQLAGVSNTDWSWSNLMADFDNDGYKDIHVTNGLMRDIRNTDADKAFSHYVDSVARTFIQNNPNAGDVSIWDILDLDEVMQIVPSEKLANYAFRNNGGQANGDLTFSEGDRCVGRGPESRSRTVRPTPTWTTTVTWTWLSIM